MKSFFTFALLVLALTYFVSASPRELSYSENLTKQENSEDTAYVWLLTGEQIVGILKSVSRESIVVLINNNDEKVIKMDEIRVYSINEKNETEAAIQFEKRMNKIEDKDRWIHIPFEGNLLIGSTAEYNRGIGVGIRGQVKVGGNLGLGGIIIYHFGISDARYLQGNGAYFFWGPEIEYTQKFDNLLLDVFFGIGEGMVKSEDKSFLTLVPGFAFKYDTGLFKIGCQLNYFSMSSFGCPAFYITFGK